MSASAASSSVSWSTRCSCRCARAGRGGRGRLGRGDGRDRRAWRRRCYLFLMRACFSGACFVQAHTRETQQAFLEGARRGVRVLRRRVRPGPLRQSRLGGQAGAARPPAGRRRTGSSRCARTTCSSRASPARARRARTRRAASRARSAGSAELPGAGPGGRLAGRAQRRCSRRRASTDLRRTIRGRRETVGEALGRELDLLRALPAERVRHVPSMRRRGSTARRWRPSGRTSTRCRSRSPGCGSRPGSARARSSSITTVARSPGTSGCTAGSGPRRSWITTSSCSSSSRARSPARCALASGARAWRAGRTASTSCGAAIQERVGASEAARQMVDVLLLCRELPAPRRSSSPSAARLAAGAHDGRAVAGPRPPRRARPARPADRTRRPTVGGASGRRRTSPATTSCSTGRPHDDTVTEDPGTRSADRGARDASCKLPTVKRRFRQLAAEATREQQTPSRTSPRCSKPRWPSAPSAASDAG